MEFVEEKQVAGDKGIVEVQREGVKQWVCLSSKT